MKNLKEFEALIKRYETITLKEIEDMFARTLRGDVKRRLTGFGGIRNCTLCAAVWLQNIPNCKECAYNGLTGRMCTLGDNSPTYSGIDEASNPKQLLTAYRTRAAYMKLILEK
ncbi:MAG TPA: hypothetical protein VMW66_00150 [Elusimicrobiales bacterium]|nr:hypothetical protein [Elusimicrobiales bacterium]